MPRSSPRSRSSTCRWGPVSRWPRSSADGGRRTRRSCRDSIGATPIAVGPTMPRAADLVWRNATLLDASGVRAAMDIVVRGGVIDETVPTGAPHHDGRQVVECHGRVVTPAFVNIHHHFYTAFL